MAIWIVSPVMGALIGWFTNRLAVLMLFRPKQPYRMPFVPVSIQGLLPRRRRELARSIGRSVAEELMSLDELFAALETSEYETYIIRTIQTRIRERLERVLPQFTPSVLRQSIGDYVHDVVEKQARPFIEEVKHTVSAQLKEKISVADIVEKRILQFDLDELEKMVLNVASPELRYIERLGALLGALIGFVQAVIMSIVS